MPGLHVHVTAQGVPDSRVKAYAVTCFVILMHTALNSTEMGSSVQVHVQASSALHSTHVLDPSLLPGHNVPHLPSCRMTLRSWVRGGPSCLLQLWRAAR